MFFSRFSSLCCGPVSKRFPAADMSFCPLSPENFFFFNDHVLFSSYCSNLFNPLSLSSSSRLDRCLSFPYVLPPEQTVRKEGFRHELMRAVSTLTLFPKTHLFYRNSRMIPLSVPQLSSYTTTHPAPAPCFP